MKDISLILPTVRPKNLVKHVIDSINQIDSLGLTYDICVYSKEYVSGPNVKWFEEKERRGYCYAANEIVAHNPSKFYACLVDDHVVCPDYFSIFPFLSSNYFEHRLLKITTPANKEGIPQRCPIKGEEWCGGIPIEYDAKPYTTVRFPTATRETIDKYLGGYILHPGFRTHAADLWLGFWMGEHWHEPCIECDIAHIEAYVGTHDPTYHTQDCLKYHELVDMYKNGYEEYV